MTRVEALLVSLCCVGALLLPAPARAQQPVTPTTLQIEPLESGFAFAPDAKVTEVNNDFATLVGGYGGWLTDRTLLVGGGAYWLANRSDDFKMQYFGGVVRWNIGGHRRVGLSTGALVGFGDATLRVPYGELFGVPPGMPIVGPMPTHERGRGPWETWRPITSDTPVRVADGFFITEPQANALWSITSWMRLDAGAGYRFIAASDLDEQLRGASGSIALQFGGR